MQINLKIIKLKKELSKANAETIDMVNDLIKVENEKLYTCKNSLETLINSFISTTSKTMQDIIKAKIEGIEAEIVIIENNIISLENQKSDKDKYIRELNNKIIALKKEGQQILEKELTREEWLDKVDKIVVGGKNDLVAAYKLD